MSEAKVETASGLFYKNSNELDEVAPRHLIIMLHFGKKIVRKSLRPLHPPVDGVLTLVPVPKHNECTNTCLHIPTQSNANKLSLGSIFIRTQSKYFKANCSFHTTSIIVLSCFVDLTSYSCLLSLYTFLMYKLFS